jgi:hypothetical protein
MKSNWLRQRRNPTCFDCVSLHHLLTRSMCRLYRGSQWILNESERNVISGCVTLDAGSTIKWRKGNR